MKRTAIDIFIQELDVTLGKKVHKTNEQVEEQGITTLVSDRI